MKRIIYIPAAVGVLAFGGIVLANTNSPEVPAPAPNASTQAQDELIGFEKASSIALKLAEGNVTDIELSEDDGRREYEVEIRDNEYEYDFDIDAFTGEVLEQDKERIKNKAAASAKTNDDGTQNVSDDRDSRDDRDDNDDSDDRAVGAVGTASAEEKISAAQASDIALKEAGGGKVEEIELDSDDGLEYYEVEVVDGNVEYDLEISAADGSVLKFEQDDDNDDDRDDDDNDDDDDDQDDDNDD